MARCEATPEAGAPEARARTLLLAGRPDQAVRLLGGVCRAGLGLSALLELGRIEEYEGRPARALECYRMALGVAGEGNQASAASGRRAALERIALLGGYAPVETLPGFGAELERAAQAGVIGAEWALARLHTHAERWSLALARANAFLARAPADDPLRPRAEAALVDLRRRDDDVRWWRRVGLWGAVGAVALLALALLVRSAAPAAGLGRGHGDRARAGLLSRGGGGGRRGPARHSQTSRQRPGPAGRWLGRGQPREEIRRLLLEPAPASAAVIGAYERLQRAAGAVGIVLRPLEREPVFGPLVQALARVEALLDRPIQGRDAGRDVGGEQEIATLDRELRERHGPALARLAAAAPRTRLDPAQVAGWMRQLAPRGAAGRAPQPGLHLPALDVELPLTEAAVHTILSNLVRNAMAAVAQAGERGGEARVLVRLEEERDAVGRRLVTLLVADSRRRQPVAGGDRTPGRPARAGHRARSGAPLGRAPGGATGAPAAGEGDRRRLPPGRGSVAGDRVGSRRARATGRGRHDMSQAPCFVVCEDGQEYTDRFTRMLGGSFRFVRAGCFAEAKTALAAGPVAALLLDLDFRRTPADQLVDEAGQTGPGRGAGERQRLATVQGLLVLRALRTQGLATPALLFADLDDAGQVAHLESTLAPVEVLSSSTGLDVIARRLGQLASAG